jgi:AraC family transcriptional regulator of adaptative response/methylated-DNA-[protein]-cysteine methyltransferase
MNIVRFTIAPCFLGYVLVAQREHGICALLLADHSDDLIQLLQEKFPHAHLAQSNDQHVMKSVIHFIETPTATFQLPLNLQGTSFQQQVWAALQTIPLGSTASYTDIAHQIGSPNAVRAVAQACASNPVAVVVPCHRVIRQDGSISGYRWGVARKELLLKREASIARLHA